MLRLRIPMEQYKGRHIGCAPGTHAALVDMVCRHVKPGSAIDFGAHSGALLTRLADRGFGDLSGCDLDPTRFDVPGAAFHVLDLNKPFAEALGRTFKLITATEVIEHLDSPRHFLSEVHKVLDEDGWLALSLPNVASWQGRVKFLLKGELWGFGERNYRTQRHISPITFEQMVMMLGELGFETVEMGAAGSFSTRWMQVLSFPIRMLMSLMGGAPTEGEAAIFLARRTQPNAGLAFPTHYRSRWKGIPDRIGLET